MGNQKSKDRIAAKGGPSTNKSEADEHGCGRLPSYHLPFQKKKKRSTMKRLMSLFDRNKDKSKKKIKIKRSNPPAVNTSGLFLGYKPSSGDNPSYCSPYLLLEESSSDPLANYWPPLHHHSHLSLINRNDDDQISKINVYDADEFDDKTGRKKSQTIDEESLEKLVIHDVYQQVIRQAQEKKCQQPKEPASRSRSSSSGAVVTCSSGSSAEGEFEDACSSVTDNRKDVIRECIKEEAANDEIASIISTEAELITKTQLGTADNVQTKLSRTTLQHPNIAILVIDDNVAEVEDVFSGESHNANIIFEFQKSDDGKESNWQPQVASASSQNSTVHNQTAGNEILEIKKKIKAEKIETEKIASGKIEADKIATDKLAVEKIAAERIATEKIAAEKIATEKIEADKIAAEKIAANKIATDKLAAEKIAADKIAAERIAAEKIAAENIAAEKIAAEKIAAEKIATEKIAAEKKATEKIAAEKIAAVKGVLETDLDLHFKQFDTSNSKATCDKSYQPAGETVQVIPEVKVTQFETDAADKSENFVTKKEEIAEVEEIDEIANFSNEDIVIELKSDVKSDVDRPTLNLYENVDLSANVNKFAEGTDVFHHRIEVDLSDAEINQRNFGSQNAKREESDVAIEAVGKAVGPVTGQAVGASKSETKDESSLSLSGGDKESSCDGSESSVMDIGDDIWDEDELVDSVTDACVSIKTKLVLDLLNHSEVDMEDFNAFLNLPCPLEEKYQFLQVQKLFDANQIQDTGNLDELGRCFRILSRYGLDLLKPMEERPIYWKKILLPIETPTCRWLSVQGAQDILLEFGYQRAESGLIYPEEEEPDAEAVAAWVIELLLAAHELSCFSLQVHPQPDYFKNSLTRSQSSINIHPQPSWSRDKEQPSPQQESIKKSSSVPAIIKQPDEMIGRRTLVPWLTPGKENSRPLPPPPSSPTAPKPQQTASGPASQQPYQRCHLCGSSSPAVRCEKCSNLIFCLSCDDMYHRHPKRRDHVRKLAQRPTDASPPPRPPPKCMDHSSPPVPPPRRRKSQLSAPSSPVNQRKNDQSMPELPKKQFPLKFGSLKKLLPTMHGRPPASLPTQQRPKQQQQQSQEQFFPPRHIDLSDPKPNGHRRQHSPMGFNYDERWATHAMDQSSSDIDEDEDGRSTGTSSGGRGGGRYSYPLDDQWTPHALPPQYGGASASRSMATLDRQSRHSGTLLRHHGSFASPGTAGPHVRNENPMFYYPTNINHSTSVMDLSYPLNLPYHLPQVQSMSEGLDFAGSIAPCGCRSNWIGPDQFGVWLPPSRCPMHNSPTTMYPPPPHPTSPQVLPPPPWAYPPHPYMPNPSSPPPTATQPPSSHTNTETVNGNKNSASTSPATSHRSINTSRKDERNLGKSTLKSASERRVRASRSSSSENEEETMDRDEYYSPSDEVEEKRWIAKNLKPTTSKSKTLKESPVPNKEETKTETQLADEWECEHCTFLNDKGSRICTVCCKTRGLRASPSPETEPQPTCQSSNATSQSPVITGHSPVATKPKASDRISTKPKTILKESNKSEEIYEEIINPKVSQSVSAEIQCEEDELILSSLQKPNIEEAKVEIKGKEIESNVSTTLGKHVTSTGTSPPPQTISTQTDIWPDSSDDDNPPSPPPPPAYTRRRIKGRKDKSHLRRAASLQMVNRDKGYKNEYKEDLGLNGGHSGGWIRRTASRASLRDTSPSPPPVSSNRSKRWSMEAERRASVHGNRLGYSSREEERGDDECDFEDDDEDSNWTSKKSNKDYYLSLEELVERRRNKSSKSQGFEILKLVKEAEKAKFTADDLQVALHQCGNGDPIQWLRENWKTVIDTVVTLASRKDNWIGTISSREVKQALYTHKGNIWAAVTDCVDIRQKKLKELQRRSGHLTQGEVMAALTASGGDVEEALSHVNKTTLKPFMMKIYGPPTGIENEAGAIRVPSSLSRVENLHDDYLKSNTEFECESGDGLFGEESCYSVDDEDSAADGQVVDFGSAEDDFTNKRMNFQTENEFVGVEFDNFEENFDEHCVEDVEFVDDSFIADENEQHRVQNKVKTVPNNNVQNSIEQHHNIHDISQNSITNQNVLHQTQKLFKEPEKVFEKVSRKSENISGESTNNFDKSPKICEEFQKASKDLSEVLQETKKVLNTVQNISAESQNDSVELQKVSAVPQNVSAKPQKDSAQLQILFAESQKVSTESQKVSTESQKVSTESQKVSTESQEVSAESQNVSAESHKVAHNVLEEVPQITHNINETSISRPTSSKEIMKGAMEQPSAIKEKESASLEKPKVALEQQIISINEPKIVLENRKVAPKQDIVTDVMADDAQSKDVDLKNVEISLENVEDLAANHQDLKFVENNDKISLITPAVMQQVQTNLPEPATKTDEKINVAIKNTEKMPVVDFAKTEIPEEKDIQSKRTETGDEIQDVLFDNEVLIDNDKILIGRLRILRENGEIVIERNDFAQSPQLPQTVDLTKELSDMKTFNDVLKPASEISKTVNNKPEVESDQSTSVKQSLTSASLIASLDKSEVSSAIFEESCERTENEATNGNDDVKLTESDEQPFELRNEDEAESPTSNTNEIFYDAFPDVVEDSLPSTSHKSAEKVTPAKFVSKSEVYLMLNSVKSASNLNISTLQFPITAKSDISVPAVKPIANDETVNPNIKEIQVKPQVIVKTLFVRAGITSLISNRLETVCELAAPEIAEAVQLLDAPSIVSESLFVVTTNVLSDDLNANFYQVQPAVETRVANVVVDEDTPVAGTSKTQAMTSPSNVESGQAASSSTNEQSLLVDQLSASTTDDSSAIPSSAPEMGETETEDDDDDDEIEPMEVPIPVKPDLGRRARQFLAEGKLPNYYKAELAVKLLDLRFEESEAIFAANECSDLYMAVSYLQQDCELCAGKFPMGKMISMLNCVHRCCRSCAKDYFTLKIKERNITETSCPFCSEPDLTNDEVAIDYFNNLDIMLKNIIETDVHELFQRKLRDRALMNEPNFRWCDKCGSGFIADINRRRIMCPDCKVITCGHCKKPWEKQHEGISCQQYEEWKQINDPEYQKHGLEAYLAENGIHCPKCKFKYDLAKGGCMHFCCSQCKFEFCSGCGKAFRMAGKCPVSRRCEKLGLHAHHPRNCLFYLRDKDPEDLKKLLTENHIDYDEGDEDLDKLPSRCAVIEQRETSDGNVDAKCGREVEPKQAGLCRNHYVEYLVSLVCENNVDPVSIMDGAALEQELRRKEKKVPERKPGELPEEYREVLLKVVLKEIPLETNEVPYLARRPSKTTII